MGQTGHLFFGGGMHGIAQVFENLLSIKDKKKSLLGKVVLWIIVFAFCNLAWVFFRAESISDALYVIGNAFGHLNDLTGYLHTKIGLSKKRLLFSLVTIVIVAIYDYLSLKMDIIQEAAHRNQFVVVCVEYIILAIIGMGIIYGAGANQFVYFQF